MVPLGAGKGPEAVVALLLSKYLKPPSIRRFCPQPRQYVEDLQAHPTHLLQPLLPLKQASCEDHPAKGPIDCTKPCQL